VRKHAVPTNVRTGEELAIAIANGIPPTRIVVHGDSLRDPELRRVATAGMGRMIIDSASQADLLASCTDNRMQAVHLRTNDSGIGPGWGAADGGPSLLIGRPSAADTDDAVAAVLTHHRLALEGLDARIGPQRGAFVSCAAAIGHAIAEMARMRDQHGILLTRLGLHLDVRISDSGPALEILARRIDETLDDACTTMDFPRPRLLLSLDSPVVEPRGCNPRC
jgi:diaminopimelate decarboxylase